MHDDEFERAMRGVKRLKSDKTAPKPKFKPRSTPRSIKNAIAARSIQSHALINESQDNDLSRQVKQTQNPASNSNELGANKLFFLRQGVQKKVLRDLKKGKRYPIQKSIDLHGLTRQQAQNRLDQTLTQQTSSAASCLLIIHGKGHHSEHGAVLKTFVATYFKNLSNVTAYCSAQAQDGGEGAMYVLLKQSAK